MARRVIKRFSDEQIERANRVDVVEYARSAGLNVVKSSGAWYKAKGQKLGGLYFQRDANSWHWQTHDKGGRGAISLCMELEQCTYVEAVKILLGEDMEEIRHAPDWKPAPEQPREFQLPDANNTYKHVFAYLTNSRGIESSVLKAMVDRKYIYENTQRSCVFVGRDKDGNARHASVRSTNTSGKVFKQDIPGSQKAYSFSVPGNSGTLNVFEAPIDLLSYVSMQKLLGKQVNDSYVALGGVTDKALERYLNDYTNIKKIRVCTDNDKPLNETKWDLTQEPNRNMFIRKQNAVRGKETDTQILFKTCTDYASFIERVQEPNTYYISLPKDKLHFSENGELYNIEVDAVTQYTLYESVKDFEKGKGFEVSGRTLYLKHFFEMPAGEKAAIRIHEKYGQDYQVVRHRPTNKDFNEDLIAYKLQQKQKLQEVSAENTPKSAEYPQGPDTRTILKNAGISDNIIDWYEKQPDKMELDAENFLIKGKSDLVFVCKDPMEVLTCIELQRQLSQLKNGIPNSTYIAYSGIEQLNNYLLDNMSEKLHLYVLADNTELGGTMKKEIVNNCVFSTDDITFLSPDRNTFAEDLALSNSVTQAIEETPLESCKQMAVGMEM